MAEMSVLFLGDWLESDVAPYLGFASEERQAAVRRFRCASDRNRSLWAELFSRWRVAEFAGVSPAEVALAHDEKGKPFCRNLPLSVSLSHSGPYIAVAIGQNAIGVDVERKRKISLAVSKRWFRPEEGRAQSFLRLWTLKEAALKYTGEGLSGGIDAVDCFSLLEAARNGNAGDLSGRNFPLGQEAVAGIVAEKNELPDKARVFTIQRETNGIYGNACFAEQDAVTS